MILSGGTVRKMLSDTILTLFLCYFYFVNGEEPTCFSRFDYDEKMLLKLLKIEDRIQKFEDITNDIKAKYEQEKAERKKLLDSQIDTFREANAEQQKAQESLKAEIKKVETNVNRHLEAFAQNNAKSQTGDIVVFTATEPSDGPASNSVTFSTFVTNIGNAYDTTTGTFTSPVKGLYYFNLHITKKRSSSIDTAGCYVKKNGTSVVRAFIDPQDGGTGADNGSYGVSNSVYLELQAGDVVSVEECSGSIAGAMESRSSFSGILVRPMV